MPRKKKEDLVVKNDKSKKPKIEVPSNHYTIKTTDDSGKLSFDIDWDRLKIHVQNALTDLEKTSKIKK